MHILSRQGYTSSKIFLSKVKPMSISSSHQELFHQPSAAEKISFVQSLMETGDLHADVAMALVKSIHTELAQPQPQGQDHSIYASYARMMASLQHNLPDVHEHVVTNWQATRSTEPEETSAAEQFIETETGGEAKRMEKSSAEEAGRDKEFWETEGETEGSESEPEEESSEDEDKEEKEQAEEKGQVEEPDEEEPDKQEGEDEEPAEEEPEKEEEPEEEEQEEIEDNVEESEIEEKELETKEEQGEEESSEEKEEPQEHAVEGEESEKPEMETSEQAGETEKGEPVEEAEHMATEAAEAAAHMEHAEGETELAEEEPPMEAE